jgi:hypothetical protein
VVGSSGLMLRSCWTVALVCTLLCTAVANDHVLKASHEALQNDFALNRDKDGAAVAGTALDDADMTHLTDSIQGLFADPAPVSSTSSKESADSAPKVTAKLAKDSAVVAASEASKPASRPNLRKNTNAEKPVAVAPKAEAPHQQTAEKAVKKQQAAITVKLQHKKNAKTLGKKSTLFHVAASQKKSGPLLVKATHTALKKGSSKSKQPVVETLAKKSSADSPKIPEKHTAVEDKVKAPVVVDKTQAKIEEKPKVEDKAKSAVLVAKVAEKAKEPKATVEEKPKVEEKAKAAVVVAKVVEKANAPEATVEKKTKG